MNSIVDFIQWYFLGFLSGLFAYEVYMDWLASRKWMRLEDELKKREKRDD